MTQKVSILLREHLPMPLIYLASAEDLARWQKDQLEWAYQQGHRRLSISCFDTAPMGFDLHQTAAIILTMVREFLKSHTDVETLEVWCGDKTTWNTYCCTWNTWFSECTL